MSDTTCQEAFADGFYDEYAGNMIHRPSNVNPAYFSRGIEVIDLARVAALKA
jgi:hypothetical protein